MRSSRWRTAVLFASGIQRSDFEVSRREAGERMLLPVMAKCGSSPGAIVFRSALARDGRLLAPNRPGSTLFSVAHLAVVEANPLSENVENRRTPEGASGSLGRDRTMLGCAAIEPAFGQRRQLGVGGFLLV